MRLVLSTLIFVLFSSSLFSQTFGPQQPIGFSEAGITAVKALDVDEDSFRDYVSISALQRTVAWYEYDEINFTYKKHIIHRGLEDITQMELADMDRDGDKDIVIAHGLSYGRVVWLSNEGNGIFSAPEEYLNSYPIFEMKVMDIDYDNDVDIIIAQDAPSTFGIEAIVWYPNDEFGNIGSESTLLLTNSTVETFDIGQLNNDSYWDIVFSKSNSYQVQILSGTGIGTFGGITTIFSPASRVDQVLAHNIGFSSGTNDIVIFRPDIDRIDRFVYSGTSYVIDDWYNFDSDVRLQKSEDDFTFGYAIIALNPLANTVTILSAANGQWYQGDGVVDTTLPRNANDIAVIHTSGSEFIELVLFNDDNNRRIYYSAYNDLQDGFADASLIAYSHTEIPTELFLGPITSSDAGVELAVFGSAFSSIYDTPAILDPQFNDETFPLPLTFSELHPGDIDQDGDIDHVLVGIGGALFVAFNQGTGYAIYQAGQPTITQVKDFDLADINGDGDLDLVVRSSDGPNGPRIFTMQYIGSEQFGGQISVDNNAEIGSEVFLKDLDSDGDKDVIVLSLTPHWFENNGSGGFPIEHIIDNPPLFGLSSGQVVDMDVDGDLDILGIYASGPGTNNYWMENDGEGSFTSNGSPQTHFISSTTFAKDIHGEDVDNDGDTDVILGFDQSIWLLERTGAETYLNSTITTLVHKVRDLGTADIDGDGDMDLFSVSSDDDLVAWYENLTNDAAGCPEDINGDGLVNINDFIQINSAYGSSCTNCPEDINGDGLVNINDFIQLNSAYGSSCDDLFGNIDQSSQLVVSSALKQDLRNQNLSTLHPSLAKHLWDTGEYISLNLFPVPNDGKQIGLRFQGISLSSKQEITYRIYDISGKLLSAKMLIADSGPDLSIQFDTPLESGIYLLHVLVDDELLVEHFVVE